mmetsp:Transcript_45481/g.140518  ORF Transcript_45481/g.140518 Transcript_45481/m.140518 type:complete len:302 (+) Transcript_45481:314-1219(+)
MRRWPTHCCRRRCRGAGVAGGASQAVQARRCCELAKLLLQPLLCGLGASAEPPRGPHPPAVSLFCGRRAVGRGVARGFADGCPVRSPRCVGDPDLLVEGRQHLCGQPAVGHSREGPHRDDEGAGASGAHVPADHQANRDLLHHRPAVGQHGAHHRRVYRDVSRRALWRALHRAGALRAEAVAGRLQHPCHAGRQGPLPGELRADAVQHQRRHSLGPQAHRPAGDVRSPAARHRVGCEPPRVRVGLGGAAAWGRGWDRGRLTEQPRRGHGRGLPPACRAAEARRLPILQTPCHQRAPRGHDL